MSRTFIIQSQIIAISLGRMKVDANYIGIATSEEQIELQENHVFLSKCWSQGSFKLDNLNVLENQVKQDHVVYVTSQLSDEILNKLAELVVKHKFKLVMFMTEDRVLSQQTIQAIYCVIQTQSMENKLENIKNVTVASQEQGIAMIGAYAACLMYRVQEEVATNFCLRATLYGGQPWYDEIAYQEPAKI